LQDWALPQTLQHLRRLLESRMGKRGKREFIQVLRLTEIFPEAVVVSAALDAIRLNAIGSDAVKQFVVARIENRQARLDLAAYPYLPSPSVDSKFRQRGKAIKRGRRLETRAAEHHPMAGRPHLPIGEVCFQPGDDEAKRCG